MGPVCSALTLFEAFAFDVRARGEKKISPWTPILFVPANAAMKALR
jgi:hypothetical protein